MAIPASRIGLGVLVVGLTGCASTRITIPGWGEYVSTRDSTIEHLSITVSISPDGTRTVTGELKGAGMASPVNAITWAGVEAVLTWALEAVRTARGAAP